MAGNYYFTTLLGEGSTGTVYRAWDLDNNQEVALKVLHERLAAQTAVVEQFQTEIATLRQLNHPHIISILDSGTIQPPNATIPLPYFATLYRPLGNLRDYLNSYHEHQKRLPVAQALTLARQIADALAHAHAQNILHLDVKPENILLKEAKDPDNPVTAVLTDFGLSHHLRTVTRLRIQPGSWPYAAPERVEGLAISPHSDTYALTVLLHLMLVGQLPYPITSQADAYEYLEAPVPPTSLPAPLNAIIQQGMAKQPAHRYPAAVALSAALAAALSHPFTDPEPPATLPPPEPVQLAKTVALAEKTFATIEVGNRIDTAQTWQKPSEYRLLIAHEDERDRIVYLDKGLIRIGRHPSNDICLNNEYVSAYHAVLERTPGRKWQVLDKGSDNRTYIDDNPLQDSDQPTPWESKQTLRIGPYFLQWQDVAHLQKNGHDQPSIPIPRTTSPDDALVELTLSAAKLELKPGQTAVLTLSVKNKSHASGHYHLSLEGSDLPVTWQNPTEPLKLLTNATGSVDIPLTALPGSAGRAGQYPCKAVVRLSDGTILTDDTLQLTIPAEARLVADMHPSYVLDGATTQIRLDNQGNTPQTYRLLARDSADKLLFYPNPERVVTVQNGVSLAENCEVRAKRRPIILLKPKILPFTIQIISSPDKEETKNGQLEVLPRLPLLAALIILALLGGLIWAWQWASARDAELNSAIETLQEEKAQQQSEEDDLRQQLANPNLTEAQRNDLLATRTALEQSGRDKDEEIKKLTAEKDQLNSLATNKPPEFVQKPKTEAEQDQLYQTVVTASDPDGDPTTVKA
ncbi:MAG: protein kinase, partial [Anaerolineales bacterium]|nr:protein kinase [Anaerolineales bacterium]